MKSPTPLCAWLWVLGHLNSHLFFFPPWQPITLTLNDITDVAWAICFVSQATATDHRWKRSPANNSGRATAPMITCWANLWYQNNQNLPKTRQQTGWEPTKHNEAFRHLWIPRCCTDHFSQYLQKDRASLGLQWDQICMLLLMLKPKAYPCQPASEPMPDRLKWAWQTTYHTAPKQDFLNQCGMNAWSVASATQMPCSILSVFSPSAKITHNS